MAILGVCHGLVERGGDCAVGELGLCRLAPPWGQASDLSVDLKSAKSLKSFWDPEHLLLGLLAMAFKSVQNFLGI